MYPHHQDTIQKAAGYFQQNPQFLAMLVGGSVAKGWAKPTSDVDVMLIVTDEEYNHRAQTQDFIYFTNELSTYEGGYIDAKIMNLDFLREVAHHGSEPARSAFYKAFPAFSRITELESLLAQIVVYPEAQRETNLRAFYSQMMLLNWYVSEAQKRDDLYLMRRMSADLVLYGGRLVLAYNRILYPYHKWLMHEVARAPEKPADFMPLAEALLQAPDKDKAQAFYDCLHTFHDWGVTLQQAVVHFLYDREWTWRTPQLALEDR